MKPYISIIFLLLLFNYGIGQTSIKGGVKSAQTNRPIARATIKIIGGHKNIFHTEADGAFTIKAKKSDTIEVSHTGYITKQIIPPFTIPILINLDEKQNLLNEVIVSTGYQSLPKERATGSFTQINNEQLERSTSTNFVDRLRDIVPGLSFNTYGNSPISIRGQSTIYGAGDPLIVIDNFPYDGNLLDINPNDIENISILKDAAAASIWGSRAGNGVIVINTKKGQENKSAQLSFNSNITITDKPDLYFRDVLSSTDYINLETRLFSEGYYDAIALTGYQSMTPVIELLYKKKADPTLSSIIDKEIEALKQNDVRNDINKYFYQKSINQQYALNIKGGGTSYSYYLSTGYDRNRENLVNNNYQRISLDAKSNVQLVKNKLALDLGISWFDNEQANNNLGIGSITSGLVSNQLYPYASLINKDGTPAPIPKSYSTSFIEAAEANGLLDWKYYPIDELNLANNTNKRKNTRIGTSLKYNIIDGLSSSILYQYTDINSLNRNFYDLDSYFSRDLINRFTQVSGSTITRPVPLGGIMDINVQQSYHQTLRSQLNFDQIFNTDHMVTAMAGYEWRSVKRDSRSNRYYGVEEEYYTTGIVNYTEQYFPQYYDNSRFSQIPNIDGIALFNDRYQSFYANASYIYNKKYIISGSGRLDQSNLFGVKTNQKGVPLWSAGLSWVASQEERYNLSFLPYLKFRATYGYNGNVNKSVSALTTARIAGRNLYQDPYATIINPPNPQLRWERVKIVNLGVDFGLINNRLTGSIEYYHKQGLDLIGDSPFPASSGVTSFRGNTANTKGNGWDVAIQSINFDKSIRWTSSLTFGHLKENVSKYEVTLPASGGAGYIQSPWSLPLKGQPYYSLYSYRWAGLDPQSGSPRGYLQGEMSSDYLKIFEETNLDNMVYNGSLRPTTFGSLINSIAYRQFDLSFSISYKFGHHYRDRSISYSNNYGLNSNSGHYSQRWQVPGDEATTNIPSIPSTPNNNRDIFYLYSDILVRKADNIRLQDIRLAYTLNERVWNKNIKYLQVFIYMANPGIIWKANSTNIDPDTQGARIPLSISAGLKIELK